jgi:hypothetical protein
MTIFRAKENRNGDGDWLLSYLYIDLEGETPWPSPASDEYEMLAGFLARANKFPLNELKAIERDTRVAAHKLVDPINFNDWAKERLNLLISKARRPDEIPEGELWSFTFCLYSDSPQRIYALYMDSVVYPLWWDPDHKVSGERRMQRENQYIWSHERCFHATSW